MLTVLTIAVAVGLAGVTRRATARFWTDTARRHRERWRSPYDTGITG